MSQDSIDIVGTTMIHEYPKCIDKFSCKQIMENDNLCLPCQKPDIESVLQVYVDVKVKCFKVIKTILGKKIIIEGIKKIKIMYVADEPTQSVHSAHWDIHFCEFILLKEHPKYNTKKFVTDVFIGTESTMITNIGKRCVDICNLLILCPIIDNKKCCIDNEHCEDEDDDNCKHEDEHKKGNCNEEHKNNYKKCEEYNHNCKKCEENTKCDLGCRQSRCRDDLEMYNKDYLGSRKKKW